MHITSTQHINMLIIVLTLVHVLVCVLCCWVCTGYYLLINLVWTFFCTGRLDFLEVTPGNEEWLKKIEGFSRFANNYSFCDFHKMPNFSNLCIWLKYCSFTNIMSLILQLGIYVILYLCWGIGKLILFNNFHIPREINNDRKKLKDFLNLSKLLLFLLFYNFFL